MWRNRLVVASAMAAIGLATAACDDADGTDQSRGPRGPEEIPGLSAVVSPPEETAFGAPVPERRTAGQRDTSVAASPVEIPGVEPQMDPPDPETSGGRSPVEIPGISPNLTPPPEPPPTAPETEPGAETPR
jgi:hypothetical protein